jgi:ABC-type polysaccharide/polyol phosphate transport system ATPase subunit
MRFWLLVMPEKSHWQDAGYFTKGGRTVLFVSHNMAAIKQLCTKQLF